MSAQWVVLLAWNEIITIFAINPKTYSLMKTIKYHYAYDDTNAIVNIGSVTLEYRKAHTFRCIACGAEMVAKLGSKNTHHFAHKNGEACSEETYLHKLAKMLLKKKFDQSSAFEIEYSRRVKCAKHNECPFYKEGICQDTTFQKFDLKKYYDTCTEEQPVDEFRADLLLTHSEKENREPVLIEIYVTHKSTEAKLNSKQRIIEIHIQSDNDIRQLMRPLISEGSNVHFYGFNRESDKVAPLTKQRFFRFFLFQSGKTFVSNSEDMPMCNEGRRRPNALLELNIDSKADYLGDITVYDYGLVYARNIGFDIKDCRLCRFHRSGFDTSMNPIFCCLYKKLGTPQYPDPAEAMQCSYFKLDEERIKKITESMPPMQRL